MPDIRSTPTPFGLLGRSVEVKLPAQVRDPNADMQSVASSSSQPGPLPSHRAYLTGWIANRGSVLALVLLIAAVAAAILGSPFVAMGAASVGLVIGLLSGGLALSRSRQARLIN
jgi:hypothetical protein